MEHPAYLCAMQERDRARAEVQQLKLQLSAMKTENDLLRETLVLALLRQQHNG